MICHDLSDELMVWRGEIVCPILAVCPQTLAYGACILTARHPLKADMDLPHLGCVAAGWKDNPERSPSLFLPIPLVTPPARVARQLREIDASGAESGCAVPSSVGRCME